MFQEGTTKVVFASNPNDPDSPMDLLQHNVRGQRSLMLMNSWRGSASLPKGMKYFDVTMDKVRKFTYFLRWNVYNLGRHHLQHTRIPC